MYWTEERKKEAIELVLDCIASGLALKTIIDSRTRQETPCYSEWHEWMKEDAELANRYARACEERADKVFEEILEIADDASRDDIETENGIIANHEWISRSRLRVDARKWALSKMNPKKYGDKVDVTSGGEKIAHFMNIDPLSNDPTDNGTA